MTRRFALVGAIALGLAASLSGCLAEGEGVVIGPEARAEVPWLIGRFVDAPAADQPSASGLAAVASELSARAPGVVRLTTSGGDLAADPDLAIAFRSLLGACPDGLAARLSPAADPELSKGVARYCAAEDLAALCAGDDRLDGDATPCERLLPALRGLPLAPPLSAAEAEEVAAMRWLSDGLPYGDEVTFAVAPLPDRADWALAEVRAIGGRGKWASFSVFEPTLRPGALVLLRRASDAEVELWPSALCVSGGGGEARRPRLPAATAIDTLAACAERIDAARADPAATEESYAPRPKRPHVWRRVAP